MGQAARIGYGRQWRMTSALLIAALPGMAWADGVDKAPASMAAVSAPATSQAGSEPASPPVPPVLSLQPTTNPDATTLRRVVVSSTLDTSRSYIAPSLGASSYTIGQDQIKAIPGGESATFQQVLLRAPGVVEDSFGQVHVRGEHGNLTYRVNGVLLPQPLNGFGQELDTHLIQSVTLIDGSLPAQFGFHTAGIVDVTTKSGASLNSNELSVYGGSFQTVTPTLQLGGTAGQFDYFVVTNYNHNNLGIENTTSSRHAIHDITDQEKLFGYFSYHIDDSSRLSLLFNGSNGNFELPNTAGLAPAYTVGGVSTGDSTTVNETQNEQQYYGVLAYQKNFEDFSLQISAFSQYGQIDFQPDPFNDLLFQGVAAAVRNSFVTNGLQFDGAYHLNDQHILRGGVIVDYTKEKLNTNTLVFGVDPNGNQTSDVPLDIGDNTGNRATESGGYLQDEFRIFPSLTLNYGLRYDRFDATFDHEDQLSPRANLVWKATEDTTLHLGYARYFVPPTVQSVGTGTVSKFVGTTNGSEVLTADHPLVERSNYYDAGVSQNVGRYLTVGLDGFYKSSRNLVDSGQFGQAVIESPYNYRNGRVYGAELSSTFKKDGFSAFANFSWVLTAGSGLDSQQFEFGQDEINYIQDHNVKLDHEGEYTASAGMSQTWKHDMVYIDFLFGSGLRSGFANTAVQPSYFPVNLGYQHIFKVSERQAITLRFDVVNVFDQRYALRDGSGLGVGAAQYGERRGFFMGLAYNF